MWWWLVKERLWSWRKVNKNNSKNINKNINKSNNSNKDQIQKTKTKNNNDLTKNLSYKAQRTKANNLIQYPNLT